MSASKMCVPLMLPFGSAARLPHRLCPLHPESSTQSHVLLVWDFHWTCRFLFLTITVNDF